MIVGRDHELAVITSFVSDVARWPAAALLDGESGIGKSTLWNAGLEICRANAQQFLVCRPAASDASLSFTGLGDLLDRVPERAFDELPPRQRQAVDVALLRGAADAPEPEWRAVSIGVIGLLRATAEQGPVLVAIDDVQWLDPSTLRVLAFVARRLADAAIGLMVASRPLSGDTPASVILAPFAEDAVTHVPVEGLPVHALGRILRDRLGEGLDRADVLHIHEQSGGNPFYAIEMGRAILRKEPQATGRSIPVPRSLLDDFVQHRLGALSDDAGETMLAVAATSRPTIGLLNEALEGYDVGRGLDESRRAGILEVTDDVVSFTHPLYGSAIYEHVSRDHRKQLHARLADCVVGEEERARHLALALRGPDREGANVLERAAARSAGRGAPDAAASLLSLAIRATPADDVGARVRRYLAIATARFKIGDTDGAMDDATIAVASARPGAERADARRLLAGLRFHADAYHEAQVLLETALAEPGLDDARLAAIHADLFWVMRSLGAFASSGFHAREALRLCRDRGDAHPAAGIVATARVLRLDVGADLASQGSGAQEIAREPDELPMREWLALTDAEELLYVGRHLEAHAALTTLLATSDARGDESGRAKILRLLAELERRSGRLSVAQAHAESALELVEQLGYNPAIETALLASILSVRGSEPAARALFQNAEALCRSASSEAQLLTYAHLGALDLSLDRLEEADRSLARAVRILFDAGIGEPGAFLVVPDAAEAAIGLEDLEAAEQLTTWLEERGASLDRPYAIATGARCRAFLLEARGNRAAGIATLEHALEEHARISMPLELARSLLALGRMRRRDGQKRAARGSLDEALAMFEDVGATIWSTRADAELAHIAGRRPSAGPLTDAEDRVARLAASGRRNREIADTLVMSVRTVESHLSHAYAKLGIRSRTELAIFYEPDADPPS